MNIGSHDVITTFVQGLGLFSETINYLSYFLVYVVSSSQTRPSQSLHDVGSLKLFIILYLLNIKRYIECRNQFTQLRIQLFVGHDGYTALLVLLVNPGLHLFYDLILLIDCGIAF